MRSHRHATDTLEASKTRRRLTAVTDFSNASETPRRGATTVITDARSGTSKEMASRVRRYTITMAFRTACFISMIFVPGPFRWVLFACAVALPYVAVIVANQANQRSGGLEVARAEPGEHPELTTGDQADVISGRVVGDDERRESRDRRVA
jgi:hypothetical protein